MKTPSKKLTLTQETLRNLNQDDLRKVLGGYFAPTFTCHCTCQFAACTCPPPQK